MENSSIYIIGCGAIGFPLAAFLTQMGKNVLAVRSTLSLESVEDSVVTIVQNEVETKVPVSVVSLDSIQEPNGIFVITAKSTANRYIANKLKEINAQGPIVIMQNGLEVETHFLNEHFKQVYRTVLYFTSEAKENLVYSVKPVKSSMIGIVRGSTEVFEQTLAQLQNLKLTLEPTNKIERFVWQKTIANVVFNSICPLLNEDNGIFSRDEKAMALGDELISECIQVARADGQELDHDEVGSQILSISKASNGLLISTLQDLNAGRPTEIDYINLAVARRAKKLGLSAVVPRTKMLGHLIKLKEAHKS